MGTMTFAASKSASWLTVLPASGSVPQIEQAAVVVGSLTAGIYNGKITITASGARGAPAVIPVTLTVTSPPPPNTGQDWPMNRDTARSGFAANDSTTTPANVTSLVLKWSASVDGKLYMSAVQSGAQFRDVVIAVTTRSSLYAFDATTGVQL